MKRVTKAKRKKNSEEAPPDEGPVRFIERPNGVYWQAQTGGPEFGPFATIDAAAANAEGREDTGYEPGESVSEAESEIGIAEWIDPDTGAPAEESVPRIEDH
jgi:hypothetical protein